MHTSVSNLAPWHRLHSWFVCFFLMPMWLYGTFWWFLFLFFLAWCLHGYNGLSCLFPPDAFEAIWHCFIIFSWHLQGYIELFIFFTWHLWGYMAFIYLFFPRHLLYIFAWRLQSYMAYLFIFGWCLWGYMAYVVCFRLTPTRLYGICGLFCLMPPRLYGIFVVCLA